MARGLATYVPTKGYFDLTEQPKGITRKTHQRIQTMQMVFIEEAEKYKDPEVRKNNQVNFEKLREYMAELQQIILSYWPHEELFNRQRLAIDKPQCVGASTCGGCDPACPAN